MANGQRAGDSLPENPIDADNLEITQAIELNKLMVNNLTAKEEGPVANDKNKVNADLKSLSQRAMVGMLPFVNIFNTCEIKVQEEIEKAV